MLLLIAAAMITVAILMLDMVELKYEMSGTAKMFDGFKSLSNGLVCRAWWLLNPEESSAIKLALKGATSSAVSLA